MNGHALSSPVAQAIVRLCGEELETEAPLYAEYAELFVHSVYRFMEAAVIINEDRAFAPTDCHSYIASQAFLGDVSFVAGIYADDAVFLEMARRYSCEPLSMIDDMARDCVTEFLNVLNGLFSVDLAKRELDVDLDAPRISENQKPFGNKQLIVPLETSFGSFYLIMAVDEFVFA